jgi:LuxR family maltose regulon positive regulatory protein
VGDYAPAVGLICAQPVQMPQDVALCAMELLRRAPAGTSDGIPLFAVAHVRLAVRLGLWEEAQTLLQGYERRLLARGADEPGGARTLGMLYYSGGYLRALRCAYGDGCDFDGCYAKMARCLEQDPLPRDQYADMPIGFWASLAGSARRGAPEEYCRAAARAAADLAHCYSGAAAGIDLLCRGELLFYQGEPKAAEPFFREALWRAAENRQYEIEHKAQFYLMRMALGQGRRDAAERLLQVMEGRLDTGGYDHRFFNYDAAQAWYFCALRKPEAIPPWLKEDFAPYGHAYYVENLGNQLKARYHFLTRNEAPLLRYAEQMLRRESVLYGRVEILALAACARALSGDRDAAFALLREVYETAAPNGIVAPLQELGRDMRTLCAAALRGRVPGIPAEWLERTRRQASSFAKVQSLMISEYEKTHGGGRPVRLSAREGAILGDLYRGLSRAEIAAQQGLSVNTVNSVISIVFQKLGAHSIVDAVRIAAEEKLV